MEEFGMGRTALILGSGTSSIVAANEWISVETPYGKANLSVGEIDGTEVVLLRRHGPGLNVPPHLINYKANISALADWGVERMISTAAVGSLRRDLKPGDIAVVEDFIDFTKRRDFTVYDHPVEHVVHVDFSEPYCPELTKALRVGAETSGYGDVRGVTYVCVEGPRYETPAEVRMFAALGGDVVGMTGVPEVILAKEMNLCYASLAIVTNYAAGISPNPLSHEEVLQCMAERSDTVYRILEGAISAIHGT